MKRHTNHDEHTTPNKISPVCEHTDWLSDTCRKVHKVLLRCLASSSSSSSSHSSTRTNTTEDTKSLVDLNLFRFNGITCQHKTTKITKIPKSYQHQDQLHKFHRYSHTTTEITQEERETWMNAPRIEKKIYI